MNLKQAWATINRCSPGETFKPACDHERCAIARAYIGGHADGEASRELEVAKFRMALVEINAREGDADPIAREALGLEPYPNRRR